MEVNRGSCINTVWFKYDNLTQEICISFMTAAPHPDSVIIRNLTDGYETTLAYEGDLEAGVTDDLGSASTGWEKRWWIGVLLIDVPDVTEEAPSPDATETTIGVSGASYLEFTPSYPYCFLWVLSHDWYAGQYTADTGKSFRWRVLKNGTEIFRNKMIGVGCESTEWREALYYMPDFECSTVGLGDATYRIEQLDDPRCKGEVYRGSFEVYQWADMPEHGTFTKELELAYVFDGVEEFTYRWTQTCKTLGWTP